MIYPGGRSKLNFGRFFYIVCTVVILVAAAYGNQSGDRVSAKEQKNQRLIVQLTDSSGEQVGEAILTETAKGVRIAIQAEKLKPGIHGIHFHENGICSPPDFMSAGEHFNPEHKKHGLKNPLGPHAGDMPNIFADSQGRVKTVIFNPMVTLEEGRANSLRDADGSALIIHESGDDQKTDPAGNSGKRVICGVIR
jgi:Cu-Zn family superoxide dismutase